MRREAACGCIIVIIDVRKRSVRVYLFRKAKLIEQHIKLKGQLKELAAKMDEIAEKERERKKKKQVVTQIE